MQVAPGAGRDAYAALHQRLVAKQRVQYASLTFAQEQRRLRIHLRRILLLHGDERKPPPCEAAAATAPPSLSVPWSHWRQQAIECEARNARRQASAQTLQRATRQWLARRSDVELPATSEWVSIAAPGRHTDSPQRPAQQTSLRRAMAGVVARDSDDVPTPVTLTAPFQVIVELLGARDLAVHYEQHGTVAVVVDLRIVREPADAAIGHLQAVGSASSCDDLQWDDHVLQLGIDAPDHVLVGGAVHVDVVAQTTAHTRVALGHLAVSLDLLATPLADQFAITRWFPLERARSGTGGSSTVVRQVKGEVRLAIRFLMRNPTRGDDVWVPYEGATTAPANKSLPLARQSTRSTSRATKAPPPKPPLSPRKRDTASPTSSPRRTARRPLSRGGYARAEAMSPPSSPSSYSSDGTAEWSPPKKAVLSSSSPSSPRARQPSSGGIVKKSLSGRARGQRDDQGDETAARSLSPPRRDTDSDEPSKPMFLKRKPYKVVFQKLDWSRVGAKTDSNWGTGGKTTAAGRVGSSPQKATTAPATLSNPPHTTSIMSERLAAVTQEVYAACHVTKETASLAQLRFRTERQRWLQALLLPEPPRGGDDAARHPATSPLDDGSLHALWTELQRDGDGATYAARLLSTTTTTETTPTSTCT